MSAVIVDRLKDELRGNPDYKTVFHHAISNARRYPIGDREDRLIFIENMVDAYIEAVGDVPDAYEVERLTDYILKEELSDNHSDKMSRNEYPIMSQHQLARRQFGAHKRKGPLNRIEVPLSSLMNIGTDGVDYSYPHRRKRTVEELLYIDEVYQNRDPEKQKEYRKFKRGKSKGVFRVNISTGEKTIQNQEKYDEMFPKYV